MPTTRILVGVIGRPHGVKGLVHITSHTADPAALAEYGPLSDDKGRRFALAWKGDGIAELTECRPDGMHRIADRDAAARLTNTRLYIDRAQLPPLEAEEFYLADLIGLPAQDRQGRVLGRIMAVHDYGAGASLEISPTMLIPFTRAAVPEVDLQAGRVVVVPPVEVEAPAADRHAGARPGHPSLAAADPAPQPAEVTP